MTSVSGPRQHCKFDGAEIEPPREIAGKHRRVVRQREMAQHAAEAIVLEEARDDHDDDRSNEEGQQDNDQRRGVEPAGDLSTLREGG